MTTVDIINKLQADQKAFEIFISSKFASDAKIKLEAKLEYVTGLLEYIQQERKV